MFYTLRIILGRLFAEHYLLLLFSIGCILVLPLVSYSFYFRKVVPNRGVKHFTLMMLLFVYLALVYRVTGIGTLASGLRLDHLRFSLIPFADGFDLQSDGLNLLLLMPLGFLLPLIWPELRSAKRLAVIAFGFSLAIEINQLLFTVRLADVNDLLVNTTGAMIGYFIFKLVHRQRIENEKAFATTANPGFWAYFRHQGVVYVALSLLGFFFLYRPSLVNSFLPDMPRASIFGSYEMYSSDKMELGERLLLIDDAREFLGEELVCVMLGECFRGLVTTITDDIIEVAQTTSVAVANFADQGNWYSCRLSPCREFFSCGVSEMLENAPAEAEMVLAAITTDDEQSLAIQITDETIFEIWQSNGDLAPTITKTTFANLEINQDVHVVFDLEVDDDELVAQLVRIRQF